MIDVLKVGWRGDQGVVSRGRGGGSLARLLPPQPQSGRGEKKRRSEFERRRKNGEDGRERTLILNRKIENSVSGKEAGHQKGKDSAFRVLL